MKKSFVFLVSVIILATGLHCTSSALGYWFTSDPDFYPNDPPYVPNSSGVNGVYLILTTDNRALVILRFSTFDGTPYENYLPFYLEGDAMIDDVSKTVSYTLDSFRDTSFKLFSNTSTDASPHYQLFKTNATEDWTQRTLTNISVNNGIMTCMWDGKEITFTEEQSLIHPNNHFSTRTVVTAQTDIDLTWYNAATAPFVILELGGAFNWAELSSNTPNFSMHLPSILFMSASQTYELKPKFNTTLTAAIYDLDSCTFTLFTDTVPACAQVRTQNVLEIYQNESSNYVYVTAP